MDRLRESLYDGIRKKGDRLTEQKKAIIDVFLRNPGRMLSAGEICGMLPGEMGIDAATVYRNVQRFISLGLAESMIDAKGCGRYMICGADHHHHHFICTLCGKVMSFPCGEPFWDRCAREAGFVEESHTIEVFGRCAGCVKAADVP